MYVEDLFIALHDKLVLSRWDDYLFGSHLSSEWHRNFISNVTVHIVAGNQLSTNQSKMILKLFSKVQQFLVTYEMVTEDDIASMLADPRHRQPLYESSTVLREVRHLGDNFIGFRYKKNDLITQRIKSFGKPEMVAWLGAELGQETNLIDRPRFDWHLRLWVVPVFRHNLTGICTLIQDYRFGMDEVVANYLRLAARSLDKASTFTLRPEDGVIIGNVCDSPLLAAWATVVAGGVAI